jgi:hypothetical protein
MRPHEGNGSLEDRRLQIAVAGGSIGGLCGGRLELPERLLPPDFVQMWASFIRPRPPLALRRLECWAPVADCRRAPSS